MIQDSPHVQRHLSDVSRGPRGTFVRRQPEPESKPVETTPEPDTGPNDQAATLAATIRALAGGVNPAALEALRTVTTDLAARIQVLESAPAKVVQFQIGEAKPGPTIKNARPEVEAITRRIAAGFSNIWLSGPAGTGKTSLARTVSEAIGRRFGSQSFAPDITSAALIGGPDVKGDYREPSFVDFYENGGVYLLDEVDAADPSILLVLNQALDNGHLPMPRHTDPARRMLKRHPDFICICAANTWGTGADAQYVGRLQQDSAFLNRFAMAKFAIGYDRDLERSLCPNEAMLETLWTIREAVESNKIRRVCGTREVVAAAKMDAAGYTKFDIIQAMAIDWTRQEREKCGL